MWLFYSPFHDFAHKVLVVLYETGLWDEVDFVASFPFRYLDGEWVSGQYDLSPLNPLGKVPTLALNNGDVIFPGHVITEYLDSRAKDTGLYPSGFQRINALQRLALGDALFEMAVQMSMERWRDDGEQREDLYRWLWPKVERSCDALDAECDSWCNFDIGHVGLIQAISYLDAWAAGREDITGNAFVNWMTRWPALAGWFDEMTQRPSVVSHYQKDFQGDTSPERHASAVSTVLGLRASGTDSGGPKND